MAAERPSLGGREREEATDEAEAVLDHAGDGIEARADARRKAVEDSPARVNEPLPGTGEEAYDPVLDSRDRAHNGVDSGRCGALDAVPDAGEQGLDAVPRAAPDALDDSQRTGNDALDAVHGRGHEALDAVPDAGRHLLHAVPHRRPVSGDGTGHCGYDSLDDAENRLDDGADGVPHRGDHALDDRPHRVPDGLDNRERRLNHRLNHRHGVGHDGLDERHVLVYEREYLREDGNHEGHDLGGHVHHGGGNRGQNRRYPLEERAELLHERHEERRDHVHEVAQGVGHRLEGRGEGSRDEPGERLERRHHLRRVDGRDHVRERREHVSRERLHERGGRHELLTDAGHGRAERILALVVGDEVFVGLLVLLARLSVERVHGGENELLALALVRARGQGGVERVLLGSALRDGGVERVRRSLVPAECRAPLVGRSVDPVEGIGEGAGHDAALRRFVRRLGKTLDGQAVAELGVRASEAGGQLFELGLVVPAQGEHVAGGLNGAVCLAEHADETLVGARHGLRAHVVFVCGRGQAGHVGCRLRSLADRAADGGEERGTSGCGGLRCRPHGRLHRAGYLLQAALEAAGRVLGHRLQLRGEVFHRPGGRGGHRGQDGLGGVRHGLQRLRYGVRRALHHGLAGALGLGKAGLHRAGNAGELGGHGACDGRERGRDGACRALRR